MGQFPVNYRDHDFSKVLSIYTNNIDSEPVRIKCYKYFIQFFNQVRLRGLQHLDAETLLTPREIAASRLQELKKSNVSTVSMLNVDLADDLNLRAIRIGVVSFIKPLLEIEMAKEITCGNIRGKLMRG